MVEDFAFRERDILPPSFYEQEVHGLARDLLGRVLGSEAPAAWVGFRGVIGEVLAYLAVGSFLMVGSLSLGRYPSSQIV